MIHTLEFSDPGDLQDGLVFATANTDSLSGRGDCSFVLPPQTSISMPLVILLHGVHGSHWSWPVLGRAAETLNRLVITGQIQPMVLAMPSDGLAGYTTAYLDAPGRQVSEWITSDVPAMAGELAPKLGDTRFIGGLSMGGWGAIRLAMTGGVRFSAMAAHSTVVRIDRDSLFDAGPKGFDIDSLDDGERDLITLLTNSDAEVPPFHLDCGTDDPLIGTNRELHRRLDEAGIPHEYGEYPGGHTWQYWRDHLTDALRFFHAQSGESGT